MTPIETDPIDPIDPIRSGRRRQKPSGGGQAIMMILAWVGGAAAAIAVAFWILQYVKPAPDPDQEVINRPAIAKNDDRKSKRPEDNKSKGVKPKTKTKAKTDKVEPKAVKSVIDLKNFQRPKMPGFRYAYFDEESFGMSDFSTASPSRKGLIIAIEDLPSAKSAKGLRLSGLWKTKTEQPCGFKLDSTNGARLWIDDQLVLDNTEQFKREPVKASRTIKPGMHKVRVEFVLSTTGGSYKLEIGADGAPERMNLTDLLEPFVPGVKRFAISTLRYQLAKSPKPVPEVRALMENNRRALELGFVENVPATTSDSGGKVEIVLSDDGRLLAGLAISSRDDQVSAIIPVYLTETSRFFGEQVGSKEGIWEAVIAKPGFAVSKIQIAQSDKADEVSLEFRRIGKEALLPADAYKESLRSGPVEIAVSDNCQPVVGLRVHKFTDSGLLGVDAMLARSGGDRILSALVDGFPTPPGRRKAPSSSDAKKRMKKLMKESAARLSGKTGNAQLMELKALAESTANNARTAVSDESRFVSLLEARRLHLLAGQIGPAFAIMDELSQDFEYEYWKDALLFFSDAAQRTSKSSLLQRQVAAEIGPVIVKAENNFEFEVAGKLAAGGKMLAAGLKDQSLFGKFAKQLEEYERSAEATKLARVAAKTLVSRPDDGKANRVMGIFHLLVIQDWDEAMKYFARSSSQDCEFIAEHDRSFDGSDAEIAMKLADCWKRIGKKNEVLEKLAVERAQKVLMQAKERAQGDALKDLEADLERL